MKIKIDKVFAVTKAQPKIVRYHRGKIRPSWIQIKGLPKNTGFIKLVVGEGKTKRYYAYRIWNIQTNVFVPVEFSFKDTQYYYDEFCKIYDRLIKNLPKNIEAGSLMLDFLKKYKLNKNIEILDLGAGTGIITELFANEGYKNITLLDFSEGMLNKAKKKKSLNECKFLKRDLKKLKLTKKYNIIMSFFSVGLPSYFTDEETLQLLSKINIYLKKDGLIMLIGFYDLPKDNPYFKTLKKGKMITNKKKGYYFDYYIGRKK